MRKTCQASHTSSRHAQLGGEQDTRTKVAIRCAKAQLQGPDLSCVLLLLVVGKPLTHRFRCGGGAMGTLQQRQLVLAVEGTSALGAAWSTVMAEYIEKIVRLDRPYTSAFCRLRIKRFYGFGHSCECLGFNRCTLEFVLSSQPQLRYRSFGSASSPNYGM